MKDYIDYFANYVGCSPDESGFIMYRPYLEGRYVEDKTLAELAEDAADTAEYLSSCGMSHETARQAAKDLITRHIVLG